MSDSEPLRWESLTAETRGGLAGLRRVASLRRADLPHGTAAAIDSALIRLRADPPVCAAPYPDQQTLQLCVSGVRADGAKDEWTLTIDTGEAPRALAGLLDQLRFGPSPRDRPDDAAPGRA